MPARSAPARAPRLVVSPSFHSSCCRLRFCCARSRLALRLFDARCVALLQRRLRGGDAGLAALELARERARIDFEQELAGLDPLAFLDGQPRDLPIVLAEMLTCRFGWILPEADTIASRSRARMASVATCTPRSRR